MNLEEGIAQILISVINVRLVAVVIFPCWRQYRIDALRHRLFLLRDELFDKAAAGTLSFNDPAYVRLRSSI